MALAKLLLLAIVTCWLMSLPLDTEASIWLETALLPYPSVSGAFEGPVIAATQKTAMIVYSDRVNVYYRFSTDGGVTFSAVKPMYSGNKVYGLSLAGATTTAASGTYMLCFVDNQQFRRFEWREGAWFTEEPTGYPLTIDQTPTGCAVYEAAGKKWGIHLFFNQIYNGDQGSMHYVALRDQYPSSFRNWTNPLFFLNLGGIASWLGHWSGNPVVVEPRVTCDGDGDCLFVAVDKVSNPPVYDHIALVAANRNNYLQLPAYMWYDYVVGVGRGVSNLITASWSVWFSFQMDKGTLRWTLNCDWWDTVDVLVYKPMTNHGYYPPGKTCPTYYFQDYANYDVNQWSAEISSARHNLTGAITIVISVIRKLSDGTIVVRETAAFQTFDDGVTWGPKLILGSDLVFSDDVRNNIALSGSNWLVSVASTSVGAVYRLPHNLGEVGLSAFAPQITTTPTMSPTIHPTVPGADDGEGNRNNQSTSTPTSNIKEVSLNVVTGIGAGAGFIAALAVANAFTFALKFGDDMRNFALNNQAHRT